MKRTRKTIALVLVFVIAVAILAGCGGSSTLTGKYVSTSDPSNYYEFFEGGKCTMSTYGVLSDITYEVKGSTVTVKLEFGGFSGNLSGNKITFNEFGEDVVYEKK